MENGIYNDLSFTVATQRFIEAVSPWCGPEHQLMITSLEKIAEKLDNRISASLLAEQTKIMRLLMRDRPDTVSDDALEDFLVGLTK